MTDYKKQGKKNRASGKAFELKVRADLESKGWIVFRNSNDVETIPNKYPQDIGKEFKRKFSQAKSKWNPFTKRLLMTQSGFPDFVCIKKQGNGTYDFEVQFVECKCSKTLNRIEKDKCNWILDNLHIPIIIASKIKVGKRINVNYENYIVTG